ncbi:hypothetical protein M8C21_022703 [Ambrosia artemisiifolia]|uniref:AB hydrolase-1 domain-containing protein n=1 Tax=Ambrosia artemisiifolia TaxID=4212 RepID=A0AAD5C806_AMBAR|nr:hypothetical protein M8C21_022703 [Ambrosia artemisiifolia]
MDQIVHKFVEVNGVKIHLAEIGKESSPTVLFIHGFPEIWYSWRHQMIAVAGAGFRAISLDCRGYGLSDPPPNLDTFGFNDIVNDILAIIDSLAIDKIFIVAKDAGVRPAYVFTLRYPTRVTGVVGLGIPHTPFGRQRFLQELPEGFYINRWREDLSAYGALYEKSGFHNSLKVPYRSLEEEYDIEDPVIKNPMLLIIGEKDYFLKFPGTEDFIKSGMVKQFASDLEIEYLPEGGHFVQEQFPDKASIVNRVSIRTTASAQNGAIYRRERLLSKPSAFLKKLGLQVVLNDAA